MNESVISSMIAMVPDVSDDNGAQGSRFSLDHYGQRLLIKHCKLLMSCAEEELRRKKEGVQRAATCCWSGRTLVGCFTGVAKAAITASPLQACGRRHDGPSPPFCCSTALWATRIKEMLPNNDRNVAALLVAPVPIECSSRGLSDWWAWHAHAIYSLRSCAY